MKFKKTNGVLPWYVEYIRNNTQPIVFNNLNNITSLTIKDINIITEAQYAIISIYSFISYSFNYYSFNE